MKVPILLPNIFNHPFTYKSNMNLKVGDYVVVPFGKSKITGVVWDEFEKKNNKNFKIKTVLKKLNVSPLKKTTIKFLNWFSEYNIIPKGMALKLAKLGVKSDDVEGRSKVYNSIVRGEQMPDFSAPESFNVMIKELQGLCVDVELDN